MKTRRKKGVALLGGVMMLLVNLMPSAVVFAEEGTPLAATEQVSQVAQAEETASVEENSTPEVSPEKVASESSKSEEVKENSAETTVQEAKEEQKVELASELTASSEAENSEATPKTEEGRTKTSTPAQQGGGGTQDLVMVLFLLQRLSRVLKRRKR